MTTPLAADHLSEKLGQAEKPVPDALSRPYLSLGNALQAEIPILIPCFNTVTYVRGMVEQLRARGLKRIFLLDNASTYPPMREFLLDPGQGVTVITQDTNRGPRSSFLDLPDYTLLPQFFCVTDPDLVLNPEMPPDFIAQLASLTERLAIGKAGLALDITDREAIREDGFSIAGRVWKIWEWEQQFWQDQIETLPGGDAVFRAKVDTTFALYNKRFFDRNDIYQAVRVAGRFTCRHLPWYRDIGLPAAELQIYRKNSANGYYLRDGMTEPARIAQ
jgi:hypothetical protein